MNEQGPQTEENPEPTFKYLSENRLHELHKLVPVHDHHGLIAFFEDGIIPGSFLQAVLENNLSRAFGRADEVNRRALFDITTWLWNYAPADGWGSEAKVRDWSRARRGLPPVEKCPECGK